MSGSCGCRSLRNHSSSTTSPKPRTTRMAVFAFQGPVEVNETYMGGKETHKHRSKKLTAGRGAVENAAAVGIKSRHTTP